MSVEKENKLISLIEEKYPTLLKMTDPLNFEQAEKLMAEYNFNDLEDVITGMENKPDLIKKYKSTNLTIRNWIRRRNGNINNGRSNDRRQGGIRNSYEASSTANYDDII